jgi:GntR family transcriptional regulator
MSTIAYKALAAELRQAILAGDFPPHRKLPTEVELAATKGLSRQTVRQAFSELVAESLVYRIRGRGSFATPLARGAYLRSFGSIEVLLSLSEDTELEVVQPFQLRTDPGAAGRLQLSTDQVMSGTVRRSHAGSVFCVTRIYVPVPIGEKVVAARKEFLILGARTATTIIGAIERTADVPIAGANQSVMAVPASPEVAAAIETEVDKPVLRIERLYFDRAGSMVELAITHFHPDRYSYRLELRRSQF